MNDKWFDGPLGQILTFKRGYDLPKRERIKGLFPIVSSSGITDYHQEYKVEGPGVVTGRYGTLGDVFYIEGNFWPLNTSLYVKDFKGNDPRFLTYFLKILRLGQQNAAGAVPGVNRNALHKLKVRVPPLPTQKKIAAILSAYDDLIENNNRRIALLERAAEEIYREWFVRMRFPGWESTKFEKGVPVGWEVVELQDLYTTSSGGTPSRKQQQYFDGEISWVKTGELLDTFIFETDEKISERGLENSSAKIFPANTVIVAMYGATIGQLGILATKASTNQACCAFLPKQSYLHYGYTFLLLKSIKDHLIAFSFGGAQQNISQQVIKKFKVLLPEKNLIISFCSKTDSIYSHIKILAKSQIELKKSRDLLLSRLISGKLPVDDLEIHFPPSMIAAEEPAHA